MKKMIYSVYYADTQKNDINYIEDYETPEDICEEFGLSNKKSIYNYMLTNIDNVDFSKMHLLKDKYVIVKEYLDNDEIGVY